MIDAVVPFEAEKSKSQPLTMSSREIAELCEKQHSHVRRDVKAMLEQLGEDDGGYIQNWTDPQNGQSYAEYRLPKDLTLTLVAGYNVKIRKRIIDRWLELEAQAAQVVPRLPDFSDPVAAARAWADEREARRMAEQTKAEIGSRREATAMNTASQAVKAASRLAAALDVSQRYATVKRMSMLYHGQTFNWRALKRTAIEMHIPAVDVFDANYGTVKAYHRDVWLEAYALDIPQTGGQE